jgi:hypothetical protein
MISETPYAAIEPGVDVATDPVVAKDGEDTLMRYDM